MDNLGNGYRDPGDGPRAVECYEQALAIAAALRDQSQEAIHSWNLGLLYADTDPSQALNLLQACVDHEHSIGHPDADADTVRLAELRQCLQNWPRPHYPQVWRRS